MAALGRIRRQATTLDDAHQGVSQDIEAEARARVRVKSGRLRSTIRRVNVKGKAVVTAGGPEAPYAAKVNYRQPGDAFLTGAANSNVAAKVIRIDRNLDSLITRAGLH